MHVVFVHGVNTRDAGDGKYAKAVAARDDRLKRLVFGEGATIHSPSWGKHGLASKTLASIPKAKRTVEALGGAYGPSRGRTEFIEAARKDFPGIIAALSIAAINKAGLDRSESDRRQIEDYWIAAAAYAEMRDKPTWLASIASEEDFAAQLAAEVAVIRQIQGLGTGWLPGLPNFDLNDIAAEQAREHASGFVAQFLGDALMFFSRREKSVEVRREVSGSIIAAADSAAAYKQPLVLIGHSMGGAVLQEILSDLDEVKAIERQLGHRLAIDLFLSVGTQIGLFYELNLFPVPADGGLLAVPVKYYWNVYDYADALAFVCGPFIKGAVDFEVNTAAGVITSHGAYFENALFFQRLKARLMQTELLA